jgi:hypothetical protein
MLRIVTGPIAATRPGTAITRFREAARARTRANARAAPGCGVWSAVNLQLACCADAPGC